MELSLRIENEGENNRIANPADCTLNFLVLLENTAHVYVYTSALPPLCLPRLLRLFSEQEAKGPAHVSDEGAVIVAALLRSIVHQ